MYTSETKKCQNCGNNFTIEPEDFEFYEKIKVPPPTWCPECRVVRRMVMMNERTLYKRKCDMCGKEVVSNFSSDSQTPVYCNPCWWSDKWDPLEYGQAYDFSKPFFEQLIELYRKVPWPALHRVESSMVGSDYCNICSGLKNCYLLFNSDFNEDCAYSTYLERSKNCQDLVMSDLCERCCDSTNLFKDYNVRYSSNCNECMDVYFSRNLIGCSDCFGCVNLRNKKYHIFNNPYTKDDYQAKLEKYNFGSYQTVQTLKVQTAEYALRFPRKYMEGLNNNNVRGDYIFNSKNVFDSYEVGSTESSRFCHLLFVFPTKDSYDFTMWGLNATHMYECMGCGGGQRDVRFSYECWGNMHTLDYCMGIVLSGSNLFGCSNLKGGEYCILNKKYSKEEYEELKKKIIEHMNTMPYRDSNRREYRYGEYFPIGTSSFAYNETVGLQYFPLEQSAAEQMGHRWKEPAIKNPYVDMRSEDLPDDIKNVRDDILSKIIRCEHASTGCGCQCPGAFRITAEDLKFYRENTIPLPRLCPNCRFFSRFYSRNILSRLWRRKCDCVGTHSRSGIYNNGTTHVHGASACTSEFETSYAPKRREIVYCEQCYQQEVA